MWWGCFGNGLHKTIAGFTFVSLEWKRGRSCVCFDEKRYNKIKRNPTNLRLLGDQILFSRNVFIAQIKGLNVQGLDRYRLPWKGAPFACSSHGEIISIFLFLFFPFSLSFSSSFFFFSFCFVYLLFCLTTLVRGIWSYFNTVPLVR